MSHQGRRAIATSPRPHRRILLLALLVAALATRCAAAPDDTDGKSETGEGTQSAQPLYVASSKVWTSSTVHVCWIDSGYDAEKAWVRSAVTDSWQRVANITFDDWGRCPSPSLQPYWPYGGGLRIRIADEGPNTSALGKDLSNLGQTMTLNFTFANWSTAYCAGANRESCIRAIAAHEFGHALGFAHEQNRPDTNRTTCTDAPQGGNGDMVLGAWDLDSIMDYCNPDWNNEHLPGYLSPLDVDGVRQIYGTRGDNRANAMPLALGAGETTVYGSTMRATHDGPAAGAPCTSGANVWYSIALSRPEVLYVDTAGSSLDTSLFVTDGAGNLVAGMANDDAHCTGGDWQQASGYESSVAGLLAAGTYQVAVGGCASGNFTLHVQHMPQALGSYYEGRISGSGAASTVLAGTSALTSSCGGAASGEDVRWFVSCGGQSALLSTCASDGGTYSRSNGTVSFDPALYTWSGVTGAVAACDDDGGASLDCQGTGGDMANYGARLSVASTARGITGVVVDERTGGSGMTYTLAYTVP